MTLKRSLELTENVRHFVLKVLCSNESVEQLLTALDHGVNLSTGPSQIRIVVESFPKVVDRLVTWLRTSINEDTNFWL